MKSEGMHDGGEGPSFLPWPHGCNLQLENLFQMRLKIQTAHIPDGPT